MPLSVPNAIAFRRSRANVLQRELARSVRVDVPRMSLIESGRQICTPRELLAVAKRLGCKPTDIYPPSILALIRQEG